MNENIEKYITFSVPITKEHNNSKTIKYKIKFIGSFRFLSSSLSNDVDNLFEELHIDKCTDCKSYHELISIEDNKLIFKCLKCNNNHNKDFNKDIIKRLANTYEFCNEDIYKFILLLRKNEFIHTNTWIAGKDLIKNYCLKKKTVALV